MAFIAACNGACVGGCDGPPARAKPWRHVSDVEAVDAAPSAAGGDARSATAAPPTLRIRLAADPGTLNLLAEPDREALQIAEDTVYETLVAHRGDTYVPRLAESFRVVGGGNEIRFQLRKEVRFSDGKPFTAVDAQAAIDAARRASSRAPRLRAALLDVVAVEIWGPRDLRVILRRPNGYVLRALAEVPMLAARELGATSPAGTGPYRVATWRRGEHLLLERRDDYWGTLPKLAAIDFVIVADAARALTLAKRGEIDILPSLIPEHWPEQANAPGVTAAFAPLDLAPPRFLAVVLNLRRPPFDDPRVRRAAAMLVDRARLGRETWRGLARPSAGPIWPGGIGDAEAPPGVVFDPVRATALLDEAGWKLDKDGVRMRGTDKLHITFIGVGALADAERDLIIAGLRRGGFAVEVRVVEPAAYFERLRSGDLDAAILDYRGRVDEDLAPFFATKGALNFGGLSSPLIDATCAALHGVWEPGARRALVAQLGALVAAETPYIPLITPTPHGLVARRVAGLVVADGWFAIRDLELRDVAR